MEQDGGSAARESERIREVVDRARELLGGDSTVPTPGAPRAERAASSQGEHVDRILSTLEGQRARAPRYVEGEEIARGGMGRIVEVFEPALRRPLAMKLLLERDDGGLIQRDPAAYDASVARFVDEAQITAQLDHPGVVPVHEMGIDAEGRPFFTMSLVGGEDLSGVYARYREGDAKWSLARVVGLLERVCETVAFAHAKGVVHRDLKPANVRVGEFGEVYVMDWGLAKVLGASGSGSTTPLRAVDTERSITTRDDPDSSLLTQEGTAAGTPSFMPPEQARGELAALDARSDVYSLGAMLYSLLAGHDPYRDRIPSGNAMEIVLAASQRAPTALADRAPQAPPELVAVCEKAMARPPDERFASAVEMGAELRAWLEGRVVKTFERGAWAELRKWVLRNRALAAAVVGGTVALLGGVTGMLVLEKQGRAAVDYEQSVARLKEAPLLAEGLLAEVDELWPMLPARASDMESWLASARAFHAERPFHVAGLADLEGAGDGGFDPGDFEPQTADALRGLIARHTELEAAIGEVARRLRFARTIEERTITGPEARDAWGRAREGVWADERFDGLELAPQLGLLPLEPDPESGLWEFWHVASGERPTRDPESGRWRIGPRTGIVLALIPGGETTVGSVPLAEDGSNAGEPYVDRYVQLPRDADELPLRSVVLDPYLLSKYEVTTGQWLRLMGADPASVDAARLVEPIADRTRADCELAAERWVLELPTETQWESACRAGTVTEWYLGTSAIQLHENAALKVVTTAEGEVDLDGYSQLAPVGSFDPNPLGLHDLYGNVWEWCRDHYRTNVESLREGDGLRLPDGDPTVGVIRGGGFSTDWRQARSANRFPLAARYGDIDTGLRLSKRLEP